MENYQIRGCLVFDKIIDRNQINECLQCAVCLELVYPLITCNSCKNIFGEICISQIKDKKCPMCRNFFIKDKNSPSIQQHLSSLKLKCVNNNCIEILNYDDIYPHNDICYYSKKNCQYCSNEFNLKELKDHKIKCSSDQSYEYYLLFFYKIVHFLRKSIGFLHENQYRKHGYYVFFLEFILCCVVIWALDLFKKECFQFLMIFLIFFNWKTIELIAIRLINPDNPKLLILRRNYLRAYPNSLLFSNR